MFEGILNDKKDDVDFDEEMSRELLKDRQASQSDTNKNDSQNQNKNDGQNCSQTQTDANDELLYDPESDDVDQKWINDKRIACTKQTESQLENSSDATLNCPCCMTQLCLDCQRHEIYRTQYRAMFVFNCNIDFSEKLKYKSKVRSKNRAKYDSDDDKYFPVKCCICNTQVAVYDSNEVYHFFNVLSSY